MEWTAVAIDSKTGNNAPVFYFSSEEENAQKEAESLTALSKFDRWRIHTFKGIMSSAQAVSLASTKLVTNKRTYGKK